MKNYYRGRFYWSVPKTFVDDCSLHYIILTSESFQKSLPSRNMEMYYSIQMFRGRKPRASWTPQWNTYRDRTIKQVNNGNDNLPLQKHRGDWAPAFGTRLSGIVWATSLSYDTITQSYCMAGPASGQGEANSVFWLATRAGKMGLSCPLGIARFALAKAKFFGVIFWPYTKSFTDQTCSSRRLDIGLVLFLRFYRPRLPLGQ